MDQVNFLINVNQTSIDLATSFMFTPQRCRSITFKVINTFNVSTSQWMGIESKNFYPQKTKNLNGCEFIVSSMVYTSSGNFLLGNLIDAFTRYTKGSIVVANGNDVDFHMRFFQNVDDIAFNPNFKLSFPFIFNYLEVLIPPGEQFSQLEMMLLPFDYGIWIAIISTLFLALVVAESINQTSNNVRNFVFGIKSPTFVLFSTFLAGRQSKAPKRNFARFCLMLFIIWSLIIRTCYQSILYRNFQANIRKPELKNIREAVNRNFTFCTQNINYVEVISAVYGEQM